MAAFDGGGGQQRWQAFDGGSCVQWRWQRSMAAAMSDCKAVARRQGGKAVGAKRKTQTQTIKLRWRLVAAGDGHQWRRQATVAMAIGGSGSGSGSGTFSGSGGRQLRW